MIERNTDIIIGELKSEFDPVIFYRGNRNKISIDVSSTFKNCILGRAQKIKNCPMMIFSHRDLIEEADNQGIIKTHNLDISPINIGLYAIAEIISSPSNGGSDRFLVEDFANLFFIGKENKFFVVDIRKSGGWSIDVWSSNRRAPWGKGCRIFKQRF